MSRRFAAALVMTFVTVAPTCVSRASAQTTTPTTIADAVAGASAVQFADEQSTLPAPHALPRTDVKWTTPVLIGLQATTIATQMLDVHSTLKAMDAGAVEGNPMMGSLVKNRAAFVGVKAAIGAGVVYATHRIGQRNKVAAIAVAAAINSAYFMIASHNYKVARSLQ
jgi:hypothetical protein